MKITIKKILKEYTEKSDINFKDVYSEMWDKMLYGVCMKYTNDINQAQDYCQNGFMKIYNNLDKYTSTGSLESWVKRVINNSIIDETRKQKIKYTDEEPEWGIMDKWSYDPDTQTDDVGWRGVSGTDIMSISKNLSPQYKAVFDLYYLEGYKHHEIANMLGISVGTSKSNLSKAKANIKKYLEKQ
jgi:RNA polymerase sigma-70 factor (ECF subfamily)|tara:strand:- start:518 stop:1072 length:555 start_codon:yes stop_codon:yes gene_type:complete